MAVGHRLSVGTDPSLSYRPVRLRSSLSDWRCDRSRTDASYAGRARRPHITAGAADSTACFIDAYEKKEKIKKQVRFTGHGGDCQEQKLKVEYSCRLSQTTLRNRDGMVSFEIRGGPHQQTDSRHLEMGGLVFRETCPPKCTRVCDLTGPDEQKGKDAPWSSSNCNCRVCLTGDGLAPAASFSLMRSTMRRLIYCWPACLVGGLSRLGRLGPGLQGAAGAAPSCPAALICNGACAGPTFLNHHPLLFIVLCPHPPSASQFSRQGILSLPLSAECHSLCLVETPSHRPLVSETAHCLPSTEHF